MIGTAEIVAGYAAAADSLITPYETAVSTPQQLAPIADHLPASGRLLDVGAGTGRDAAWFSARGFDTVAVEPVAAFRAAGQRLHEGAIDWRAGRLPDLDNLGTSDGLFDLILANGVWHHLSPESQTRALQRLADLAHPGGRLILSLRHGPTPADRPGFPIDPDGLILQAAALGLTCLERIEAGSHQPGNRASGVTWTWCAFANNCT